MPSLASTDERRWPRPVRALRHRDFRVFWLGAIVSNAGAQMQVAALGWVVAVATHSAFQVALIGFAYQAPMLPFGPLGGSIADRFPRRRTLLITQSIQMALAFLLVVVWQAGLATYPVMLAIALAIGISAAVNAPVWQSLVPELVPPGSLQNAIMLNSTQFNLARAVGPMLGGVVLAHIGPGFAFFANALSYGAVIAALALMSPPRPRRASPRTPVWSQFREAVAYARGERGIVVAISMIGLTSLVGAPLLGLVPIIALELGVGAAAFGLLGGALGAGAIVGAVVLGNLDTRLLPSRMETIALALYSVSILGLGLAPVFGAALVAMVGIGLGYLGVVSTLSSAIQRICDDRLRGRVSSLWLMTFGAMFPIGVAVQGALADVFGAQAVVAGDGVILAAALVAVRATGLLSHLDAEGPLPAEAVAADPLSEASAGAA